MHTIKATKKCIVILGMHRSGTSTITGVFDILGISAGTNLMWASKCNEKGHYECVPIYEAHEELLNELSSFWNDVRFLPDNWLSSDVVHKYKLKIISLFKSEYANNKICVLKDPRICHLLPLWLDIFNDLEIEPLFVFTRRYPDEVVASLAKRDGFSENSSRLLYINYLLDAEYYSRGYTRCVIDFSDLLTDWAAVLKKIDAQLALNIFPLSEETIINIQEFLAPELKHFTVEPSLADSKASLPETLVINVYELLGMIDCVGQAQKFDYLLSIYKNYLQSLEPGLSQYPQLILQSGQEVIFQQLGTITQALQLANHTNSQLVSELTTLKSQHKKLNEEILRAQGQLELLKDLMIATNQGLEQF